MHSQATQKNFKADVIIVGAGPIGIELAIALHRAGVDYLLLEAKQIGHAISQWPTATHFYSTPEHVALAGVPVHNVSQQPVSGEQYLAYLRTLVEMYDLRLHVYEPVTDVEQNGTGFVVRTRRRDGEGIYRAAYVVLATGGMARTRRLGIPGEDLPHVNHRFPGPHAYFRTRVVIVGGKNSALESALRCWRAGAQVTISYRRAAFEFDVVKPHLAMDIRDRLSKDEVAFLPSTVPVAIEPSQVLLAPTEDGHSPCGQPLAHPTDFVLLCIGFEADMSLFEKAGVMLSAEGQIPAHDPQTMETNVPGLFVAGTAAAGTQERFTAFISTCHDDVARIVKAITGEKPDRLGTVPARNNAVTWQEVKAN